MRVQRNRAWVYRYMPGIRKKFCEFNSYPSCPQSLMTDVTSSHLRSVQDCLPFTHTYPQRPVIQLSRLLTIGSSIFDFFTLRSEACQRGKPVQSTPPCVLPPPSNLPSRCLTGLSSSIALVFPLQRNHPVSAPSAPPRPPNEPSGNAATVPSSGPLSSSTWRP